MHRVLQRQQQNLFAVAKEANKAAVPLGHKLSLRNQNHLWVQRRQQIYSVPRKQGLFKNVSLSANTVVESVNGWTGNIQRQGIRVAH